MSFLLTVLLLLSITYTNSLMKLQSWQGNGSFIIKEKYKLEHKNDIKGERCTTWKEKYKKRT